MKKLFLPFLVVLIAISAILMFSNFNKRSSGAPAGNTGSPSDGQNCTSCHGGTAAAITGVLSSNIPVSGYVAGANYTITVTLPGTGNKGFEVSPQNAAGTLLGTLTAGTGMVLKGTGKYITHSSVVTTNPAVWNFTWTAPTAGTGTVTFYGAFTITEPVTKISTMVVNESTASVSEIGETTSNFVAFPNPATNTLCISYYVSNEGTVSLQLYDISGKLVKDVLEENNSSIGNNTKSFSVGNDLKSGVYFLRFINGNKIETKKIVIN